MTPTYLPPGSCHPPESCQEGVLSKPNPNQGGSSTQGGEVVGVLSNRSCLVTTLRGGVG